MIFGINGTKDNRIFHDPTTIDMKTCEQFRDCLGQEHAIKGALMPDCHLGYTMPIGGVIATKDAVYPSWVGYDIGCGVLAYKTPFLRSEVEGVASRIYSEILRRVPTGFSKNKRPAMGAVKFRDRLTEVGRKIYDDKGGAKQLGTLGGGNHFIEVGYGRGDQVYVVIHSGSRGVGHRIAGHYIALAHPEGKEKEGSYCFHKLGMKQEFHEYLNDCNVMLDFALENRKHMLVQVLDAIAMECADTYEFDETAMINRNHNHVDYDARADWYVHRKGATHAEEGMYGVIPGNMRDGSIITIGRGFEDSLCSSSHGAGRAYSRSKARKELDPLDFKQDMKDVVACSCCADKIDEAPRAYKDFNKVIEEQNGLLFDIVDIVKPIINVKG